MGSTMHVKDNNYNDCTVHNYLQGGSPQVESDVARLMYDLPEKMPLEVVGRDRDVDVIYNLLRNDGRRRVSITGLGGIGKTTLAMYCAERWCNTGANVPGSTQHQQEQEFYSVAFIHSETTEAFAKSIQGLAAKLRIPDKQALRELAKDVADMYFKKNKDFLFILDNVERCADVQVLLEVQESRKNVFILATSQNNKMDAHFSVHAINMFKQKDTVQLFRSILEQSCRISAQYVGILHKLLGGLPLAVSHAAYWIYDMLTHDVDYTSCDEYAVEYINKYKEMLAVAFPDQFQTINQKAAFITIKINIEKISSDSQIFLNYLSYLDPDNIQIKFFKIIYPKLELKTVVRDLTKYSLITVDGEYYRIHRMVQEVGRGLYQGETDQLVTLYVALRTTRFNDMDHTSYLVQHISVFKLLAMLDKAPMEPIMAVFRRVVASRLKSQNNARLWCYRDVDKWPPLHLVAGVEFYSDDITSRVVRRLVESGESINGRMEDGLTPLHVACMVGHSECVYVLVCYNADVHATDTLGNTALHVAAQCNSYIVIDTILKAGADVNHRNHAGDTPLHLVVARPFNSFYARYILHKLIGHGADVNIKNEKGKTTLNVAKIHGDPQTVELLIKYDLMRARDDTVLHAAARILDCKHISKVCYDGVEVNCRNKAGDTPLHLAAAAPFHEDNTPDTIRTLIQLGADISIKNNQGETAHNVAVNHGDLRTARLLIKAQNK